MCHPCQLSSFNNAVPAPSCRSFNMTASVKRSSSHTVPNRIYFIDFLRDNETNSFKLLPFANYLRRRTYQYYRVGRKDFRVRHWYVQVVLSQLMPVIEIVLYYKSTGASA
jgi:hypothetical protein